jgi:hypothetical protein
VECGKFHIESESFHFFHQDWKIWHKIKTTQSGKNEQMESSMWKCWNQDNSVICTLSLPNITWLFKQFYLYPFNTLWWHVKFIFFWSALNVNSLHFSVA